jgi:antitoxin component of MazEF toxin-antitoxin module
MEHRLAKHGDGWALAIGQDWLDLLEATGETAFEVDVRDGALVVTPVPDAGTSHDAEIEEATQRRAAFEASLTRIHEQFAGALQRLAAGDEGNG